MLCATQGETEGRYLGSLHYLAAESDCSAFLFILRGDTLVSLFPNCEQQVHASHHWGRTEWRNQTFFCSVGSRATGTLTE